MNDLNVLRKPFVAGNWKMHGSIERISNLLRDMASSLPDPEVVEMAVFPPFVYLQHVSRCVEEMPLGVGAQSADWRAEGAFTGEISPVMLVDIGCRYCIVGHSERRQFFGDTDDTVALRYEAVAAAGLVPVLCVGETLDERRANDTLSVVTRQVDAVVDRVGIGGMIGMVAYEPVWAIGTGESATPEQAQEVHGAIRAHLATYDRERAAATRIVYGGSVNAGNAGSLFSCADIDGGLVGGAALKANDFARICQAAATAG